jgi:GT2 family glycosyltransferase
LKTVSLITVNYNQEKVTLELLESVYHSNDYTDFEMIVVDNGSTSNPIALFQQSFPQAIYIRSEKNLGFAGGNNLGIRQAEGKYLFFINNDTTLNKSLIGDLVNCLDEKPKVGIVSPMIMYHEKPELIQYAGYSPMNFYTGRNTCVGQHEQNRGQYDKHAGITGYAHGAAMMVRREAIAQAGMMPENFFLYYEEMDWCERIKDAGYQVWIEPRAHILHKESISVGKNSPLKEYYLNRNRILFIRRNAPGEAALVFCLYFTLAVIPRNTLRYLATGRPDLASAFFKAIWWNLSHKKDSFDL